MATCVCRLKRVWMRIYCRSVVREGMLADADNSGKMD